MPGSTVRDRPPDPPPAGAAPAAVAMANVLSAVPSTLRIPLAARAYGDAMFPEVAVGDAGAAATLAAIGDDGQAWLADRPSVYCTLARTRRYRSQALRFLSAHPDARIVNLGCGLSDYFQWLDNGRARMTDADLAEVLALRSALLPPPGARCDVRQIDLSAPGWWKALSLPRQRNADAPVFLFSEGVLMYLTPAQVAAVLATFGERAPAGSLLAFDALTGIAVGHAGFHPSLRRTAAQLTWGPRQLEELTDPHPRLRLRSVDPLLEGFGWPYSVSGPLFRALTGVPLYAIYTVESVD